MSGVCGCLRAMDPWRGRLGQAAFTKVILFYVNFLPNLNKLGAQFARLAQPMKLPLHCHTTCPLTHTHTQRELPYTPLLLLLAVSS